MRQNVKLKKKKGNNTKPLLEKRKIRFNNISDIRRFLSRTLNELDSDIIQENKARSLGYLCNIMKDVIRDGDLEARLIKLEQETLNNGNDRKTT